MTLTGIKSIPTAVWTPCMRSLSQAEKEINLCSIGKGIFQGAFNQGLVRSKVKIVSF